MRALRLLPAALALAAAAQAQSAPRLPPLPDSSGWGTPILALGRARDGAIWVGTYGEGIYVLRPGAAAWDNLRADSSGHGISSDFVHAFAFGPGRDIWYGTVGNGWGLSRDDGRTWENWDYTVLGPKWQYVAPDGLILRGDTLYVATADGLQYTWDGGRRWGTVRDSGRAALPGPYVLTAAAARDTGLWVATLKGLVQWIPGVGSRPADPPPVPALGPRVRSIFVVMGDKAVVPLVLGGESCPGASIPSAAR